jgi:hypothetical protein
MRRFCFNGGSLPERGHVDAETPGLRGTRFAATYDPSAFIVGSVIAVGVNCGGTGLQPDTGWTSGAGEGVANRPGGFHTRIHDEPAIFWGLATADVTPGQVDDNIGGFELGGPGPQTLRVPGHHTPWRGVRIAAGGHYFMPTGLKGAPQSRINLSSAACQHNFRDASCALSRQETL